MIFKLSYDYRIETDLFTLRFEQGTAPHATIKRTPESATIYMPLGFQFEGAASMEWANKVLAEAMRNNAQVILSKRVRDIAAAHNIQLNRLSIKNVSTRWGSCSSLRNVNLSLWLLLLPLLPLRKTELKLRWKKTGLTSDDTPHGLGCTG